MQYTKILDLIIIPNYTCMICFPAYMLFKNKITVLKCSHCIWQDILELGCGLDVSLDFTQSQIHTWVNEFFWKNCSLFLVWGIPISSFLFSPTHPSSHLAAMPERQESGILVYSHMEKIKGLNSANSHCGHLIKIHMSWDGGAVVHVHVYCIFLSIRRTRP